MFLNKILSKFYIAAKAFSFAIAEAGVEGSWVLAYRGKVYMYVFSSGLSNDRMP